VTGEVVFLDGALVPAEKAAVPALSRAVLYGEGLFETFRTYDGRPFALPDHLARLTRSARELGVPLPKDLLTIDGAIAELLARNRLTDGVVRVSVLAGEADGGFAGRAKTAHLLAIARPLPKGLDEERARGVAAVTARAGSLPLAAHKATAYLRSVAAARGRVGRSAREVLLIDDAGNVLEGATSNVFAIVRDALVTPPADGRILPGVTRRIVLSIAADTGLPHREHPLTPKLVAAADGLLLTNSVIEVLPVVTLDGRSLGRGKPPSLAKMLHDLYRERVEASRPKRT
jgi:branched-subunit amino acid aminotransferase/4-amino-4-deoxychorismate lyase